MAKLPSSDKVNKSLRVCDAICISDTSQQIRQIRGKHRLYRHGDTRVVGKRARRRCARVSTLPLSRLATRSGAVSRDELTCGRQGRARLTAGNGFTPKSTTTPLAPLRYVLLIQHTIKHGHLKVFRITQNEYHTVQLFPNVCRQLVFWLSLDKYTEKY